LSDRYSTVSGAHPQAAEKSGGVGEKRLDCLVYLYDPRVNRRKGDLRKITQRLELVCGPLYAGKLAMVTTMWDKISSLSPSVVRSCEIREKALEEYWRAIIIGEIKTGRFDARKEDDAWSVVNQVLCANGHERLST
jgi:hypothetical protein